MPNKEGGYGGYQRKPDRQRQVRAPGSRGGVRRVPPGGAAPSQTPRSPAGQNAAAAGSPPAPPTTAAAGLPRPLCAAHRRRG